MPPDQPTPEERSYGAELLKQGMWEKLGVDYTKGPFELYDDSPTVPDVQRRRASGHPTIGDLQSRSDEMELRQQAPPEVLAPPRAQNIHLLPIEHNPFSVHLVPVEEDPFI